ncbi:hypothetical protein CLU79DRAFT_835413 [Phycomyces nitens]|nr:hypothetical protein CLU79DRAFT_835413 [Phycomyces nitens]
MADDVGRFNSEPIMLRHPSSLVEDDKLANIYKHDQSHHFLLETEDEDGEALDIPQNLAPEQFRYEFPPRSRIEQLDRYDPNHQFYLDESSFTTTSTSTAACSTLPHDYDVEHDSFYNSISQDHQNLGHYIDSYEYPEMPPSQTDYAYVSWTEADRPSENSQKIFVEDGRLSPLQLPAQFSSPNLTCNERRAREQSYDSTVTVTQRPEHAGESPVGPSSFLSGQRRQLFSSLDRVDEEIQWEDDPFVSEPTEWYSRPTHATHPYQRSLSPLGSDDSNMPVYQSESELYLDSDTNSQYTDLDSRSDTTTASKVVIKLNRANPVSHRPSSLTFYGSDEGYYDEDDEYTKEMPIESASVFLPLSEEEQDQLGDQDYVRVSAAIQIQAVWRGYRARQELRSQCGGVKPTHRLMVGIMRMCGTVHRQQMTKMEQRLYDVEQCLREETAMRIAFEKAMEDMTLLVDQQQKALHERLEQEVSVREAYERKFEHAFEQIQPLESRLKKETKARCELESMMKHVIDQVHDMKMTHQQQEKEEVRSRKALQAQLDEALGQIALLKKPKSASPSKVLASVQPRPQKPASSTLRPTTPLRPKTLGGPTTPVRTKPSQTTPRNIVRPATSAAIVNPRSTATPVDSGRRTRVPLSKPLTTKSTAPVARKTLVSRK